MKSIELYTREGHYVTTIDVPDFPKPAEVIVWGLRFFVLDAEQGRYREAFAYLSPMEKF